MGRRERAPPMRSIGAASSIVRGRSPAQLSHRMQSKRPCAWKKGSGRSCSGIIWATRGEEKIATRAELAVAAATAAAPASAVQQGLHFPGFAYSKGKEQQREKREKRREKREERWFGPRRAGLWRKGSAPRREEGRAQREARRERQMRGPQKAIVRS